MDSSRLVKILDAINNTYFPVDKKQRPDFNFYPFSLLKPIHDSIVNVLTKVSVETCYNTT